MPGPIVAGMATELSTDWLSAMPDVLARLEGIRHPRVADVGCGDGSSTIAVASALLDAHVDGLEADADAIAAARALAAGAGVDGRVRFVRGGAALLRAHGPYDLVLLLGPLDDVADPVGALRAARAGLTAGGSAVVAGGKCDVRELAAAAGYARAAVVPVVHDLVVLYRLDP